ncbi:hypothetical protein RRG08_061971 [Elysia crispata]|uniref:Uncharacterized protein n=1 Tax=Elysia crispata TaxID=231223 RepID=A0AAE0ZIP1_9GAST|nr:hypothetical protein RRG08_061971 [Elysia crispata]
MLTEDVAGRFNSQNQYKINVGPERKRPLGLTQRTPSQSVPSQHTTRSQALHTTHNTGAIYGCSSSCCRTHPSLPERRGV